MRLRVNKKPWWKYLPDDLQQYIEISFQLADKSAEWSKTYYDYSFIVFPAAKAYEGFLKKLFLDMGFITRKDYLGKQFRIGKALNPDINDKYKGDDWVYDKLEGFCGGKELPEKLWTTWKQSRNLLFHWFPEEKNVVSHNEAVERLLKIMDAIDEVYTECEVELNNRNNDLKKNGKQ